MATTHHVSSLTLSSRKPVLSSQPSYGRRSLYVCKPISSKILHLRHNNFFNKTSESIVFATYSDEKVSDNDVKELREECGVVAVYGDPDASRLCCDALRAIQHRGQEGAGIVTAYDNVLFPLTGVGLVGEVFDESKLGQLPGEIGIGHVRYSTTGASMLQNVQPFVSETRLGHLAVAHNGNLTNYEKLKKMLQEKGCIFNTCSDTEAVLRLIDISKKTTFVLQIIDACEQLVGSYSMVFLTKDKLVAVRDPRGFRPLVMGRRSNGSVVFASETCALDIIQATYKREVKPGEVIVVDKYGTQTFHLSPQLERSCCSFEPIYFSWHNSEVFGLSVHDFRYNAGIRLATESPVDCDVVIPVPHSGVIAAEGYAFKAGIPYAMGLHRRPDSGRTFIQPTQESRDIGVKRKLTPDPSVLEGKRVVVVDDSIVRGTTAPQIVRMIREAGAKEVHMRIACPPIIGPCMYGVNIKKSELLANGKTVEEMRQVTGCDSLAFLSLESLKNCLGDDSSGFCKGCFTNEYPIPSSED
ncbi:Amidophosphoribosyltransferase protein [Thalictrum thalictroides]|uniref:Amidophosphoribosyltransferase n=1 Tax=Thalictrum thalictroides TaxID=46969 RepID=A0A7J6UTG9_THATH|nr:Amidophosphoribosyltransferase protein [Thalictrum thalictroides]